MKQVRKVLVLAQTRVRVVSEAIFAQCFTENAARRYFENYRLVSFCEKVVSSRYRSRRESRKKGLVSSRVSSCLTREMVFFLKIKYKDLKSSTVILIVFNSKIFIKKTYFYFTKFYLILQNFHL